MKLSVIIVSYNTRALTLDCIESIYEQTAPGSFELLVVDNASSDGSAEAIRNAFPPAYNPELKLYALSENLGFAAANNLAAAEARGEYVLLLNPDTVVLDRALEKLAAFADANPQWGIYGGSTVFADGSRNPTAGWMKPSVWSLFSTAVGLAKLFPRSRVFNPEMVMCGENYGPTPVDVVGGCLLLMRREHWQQLSGFDERFFMYGEDDDLCLRSRELGLSAVLVPEAQIVHHAGASETVRSDKLIKVFRAKVQLFEKHYRPGTARTLTLTLELWVVMRIVYMTVAGSVSSVARGKRTEWLEIWRARNSWSHPIRSIGGAAAEAPAACYTQTTRR